MFFVTGDTHGDLDIHKLNSTNFPIQKELTRDDYVIICGDFGLVWDGSACERWWQEWLADKPFTSLFVDGNHENHDLLEQYPVSEWNGGKVHYIQPNIIHLMRGQVFDIDGVRFFTMGGAASHDKEYREEGISWWAKEMPSVEEMAEAERNLERVGWKVDYVITHDAPTSVQAYLGAGRYVADELNAFFERLLDKLEFDTWYFGHYHIDAALPHRGQGPGAWDQGRYQQNAEQFADDFKDSVRSTPGGKREFRAIYHDIVMMERERAFMFGMPVQELGIRSSESRGAKSLGYAQVAPHLLLKSRFAVRLRNSRARLVHSPAGLVGEVQSNSVEFDCESNRDLSYDEKVFYHVTLAQNVASIQRDGLIPQVGERAREACEREPAVYLFPSIETMEDAEWLWEWYDENYGEDCRLAIVRVELPVGITVEDNGVEYERICKKVIPPECLSFYKEDGTAFLLGKHKSVDEKIENAMHVFDSLKQYEEFLVNKGLGQDSPRG